MNKNLHADLTPLLALLGLSLVAGCSLAPRQPDPTSDRMLRQDQEAAIDAAVRQLHATDVQGARESEQAQPRLVAAVARLTSPVRHRAARKASPATIANAVKTLLQDELDDEDQFAEATSAPLNDRMPVTTEATDVTATGMLGQPSTTAMAAPVVVVAENDTTSEKTTTDAGTSEPVTQTSAVDDDSEHPNLAAFVWTADEPTSRVPLQQSPAGANDSSEKTDVTRREDVSAVVEVTKLEKVTPAAATPRTTLRTVVQPTRPVVVSVLVDRPAAEKKRDPIVVPNIKEASVASAPAAVREPLPLATGDETRLAQATPPAVTSASAAVREPRRLAADADTKLAQANPPARSSHVAVTRTTRPQQSAIKPGSVTARPRTLEPRQARLQPLLMQPQRNGDAEIQNDSPRGQPSMPELPTREQSQSAVESLQVDGLPADQPQPSEPALLDEPPPYQPSTVQPDTAPQDELVEDWRPDFKPIGELTTRIAAPASSEDPAVADLVPPNYAERAFAHYTPARYRSQEYAPWRAYASTNVTQEFCHRPLYFEELNLERFGYHYGILQPAVSAVRFYTSTALLPYKMARQSPALCRVDPSPFPPGVIDAPMHRERLPFRIGPALVQAATVAGLIAVIP